MKVEDEKRPGGGTYISLRTSTTWLASVTNLFTRHLRLRDEDDSPKLLGLKGLLGRGKSSRHLEGLGKHPTFELQPASPDCSAKEPTGPSGLAAPQGPNGQLICPGRPHPLFFLGASGGVSDLVLHELYELLLQWLPHSSIHLQRMLQDWCPHQPRNVDTSIP